MHFVQRALAIAGLGLSFGLLANSAVASLANPVAGAEYQILASPQPTEGGLGKRIEVTEFFWYSCPHCSSFEPLLEDWIAKQGNRISFKRVPIASDARMVPEQKLYYALEAMGKVPALHKKVFDAIHVQHLRLDSIGSIADFITRQGIDKSKFVDVYNSFSVQAKATRAAQLQSAYKVDAVPTLVVDGRFMTSPTIVQTNPSAGNSESSWFQSTLQVMDGLVTKAAAEKSGAAALPAAKK